MNDEEKVKLDEQEYRQKKVVFYQTILGAWIENRMEFVKRLLTLSGLAIGLLMIFHDNLNGSLEKWLWFLAVVLFLATIMLILFMFLNNSKYIETIISDIDANYKNDDEKNAAKAEQNKLEKRLDRRTIYVYCTFFSAILLTCLLAFVKIELIDCETIRSMI